MGNPTLGPAGSPVEPSAPATYALVGCPWASQVNGAEIIGINANSITGRSDLRGFLSHNGVVSIFSYPGQGAAEGEAVNRDGVVASNSNNVQVGKGFVYNHSMYVPIDPPGARKPRFWASTIKAR